MTDERIWIVLPLPTRVLSPNCRKYTRRLQYMHRQAAQKQKRMTVEAIEARGCRGLNWDKCRVSVKAYFKNKRSRDEDNFMGSLKHMYDGIVAAGVVPDDNRRHMIRELPDLENLDKDAPRMEITITREDDE